MSGERCSHVGYLIDDEKFFCPKCMKYFEYTSAEKADLEKQVFERVARQLSSYSPQFDRKYIWLLYKYALKYKKKAEEESK